MNKAYQTLEERFRRMSALGGAMSILGWDRSVMMPSGSAGVRAEQMAALGVMHHELQTAADMEELLGEAEEAGGLDDWQEANLREMRWRWEHATDLRGQTQTGGGTSRETRRSDDQKKTRECRERQTQGRIPRMARPEHEWVKERVGSRRCTNATRTYWRPASW